MLGRVQNTDCLKKPRRAKIQFLCLWGIWTPSPVSIPPVPEEKIIRGNAASISVPWGWCRKVGCSCVVCEMGDREGCNRTRRHEPALHFAELRFWQRPLRGPRKGMEVTGWDPVLEGSSLCSVCFVLMKRPEGCLSLWLMAVYFSRTGKRRLIHKQTRASGASRMRRGRPLTRSLVSLCPDFSEKMQWFSLESIDPFSPTQSHFLRAALRPVSLKKRLRSRAFCSAKCKPCVCATRGFLLLQSTAHLAQRRGLAKIQWDVEWKVGCLMCQERFSLHPQWTAGWRGRFSGSHSSPCGDS